MKYYNKFLMTIVASALLVSCADNFDSDFTVDKPEDITRYEYLNVYDALKTYIDRNANPNFKLGAGVTVSNFLKKELEYSVITSNFDEVTAGNAMKYSSCVGDNGLMDFSQVAKFVDAARTGGLTIYGHTLAWHAQQNNKYLNGLIKDKEIEVDPNEKLDVEDYVVDYSKDSYTFWKEVPAGVTLGVNASEGCLEIINPTPAEQNYLVQYHTADGIPTIKDQEYKLKMMIRGSDNGRLTFGIGPWGDRADGAFEFDTEWKEYEFAFKAVANGGHVMTQSGLFAGTLQIKYVKITHSEAPTVDVEQEKVMRTYQDGPFPFYVMGVAPPVIDGCIHFEPTGEWAQFFVLPGGENVLEEGNYVVYLDLTSSKDGDGVQLTMQNGWGGTDQNITVPVPIRAGSQVIKLNFSNVLGGNYDVILKPQTCDATLDLRSVRVCKVVKSNSIPLTPEEKKEVLTLAMGDWVKGMMDACGGYVTTWDVVNEPISGRDVNGDGYYELQSAVQGTVSDEDIKNNFYWQDYLGDLEYVRTTIKFARQYYQESGGNPSDLKLFINDYNLESDWDDNNKLKSLINWIERWEEDGTVIDGIGTQMHVSYHANPAIQESKEKHIVKMYELMAATGKLVKVSELDMGYVDENNNSVLTEKMTEEQHKAMAEFYTFIIKKYFEIIPAAQRYGITQWAPTDSPNTEYSWRKGEPIGLWDLNYNRKPAYGGFANGLAGKDITKE